MTRLVWITYISPYFPFFQLPGIFQLYTIVHGNMHINLTKRVCGLNTTIITYVFLSFTYMCCLCTFLYIVDLWRPIVISKSLQNFPTCLYSNGIWIVFCFSKSIFSISIAHLSCENHICMCMKYYQLAITSILVIVKGPGGRMVSRESKYQTPLRAGF